MHALIIEDESFIQLMIEECLRDLGYSSFDLVASVGEAINAAKYRHPDLLTCDARLPDGTGMDAVAKICSARSAPVLFVVGNEFDLGEIPPYAVVLTKPFTLKQFSEAVSKSVEAFRACRLG